MIVNHISPAGKRRNRIAHLQTTCCYKVTKSQHYFMPKVTKCHQADTILCPRSQNATKQTQYYAPAVNPPPPPLPSTPCPTQPPVLFCCTNIKKICWQKIPNVSASFMKPLELCDALTTYLYAKILWLAHVLGWLFPPTACIAICTWYKSVQMYLWNHGDV